MNSNRPHWPTVALLATSIVCSVVSFTALLLRPAASNPWRLPLNIAALLLVIFASVRLRLGTRRRDA